MSRIMDVTVYSIINMALMGSACFQAELGLNESYPFLTIGVFAAYIEVAIKEVSK